MIRIHSDIYYQLGEAIDITDDKHMLKQISKEIDIHKDMFDDEKEIETLKKIIKQKLEK